MAKNSTVHFCVIKTSFAVTCLNRCDKHNKKLNKHVSVCKSTIVNKYRCWIKNKDTVTSVLSFWRFCSDVQKRGQNQYDKKRNGPRRCLDRERERGTNLPVRFPLMKNVDWLFDLQGFSRIKIQRVSFASCIDSC